MGLEHATALEKPQASAIALLTRRLVAIVIDGLLFWPLWSLSNEMANWFPEGLTPGEVNNLLKDLGFHVVFLLYFFVTEAMWGCTAGKWLLRLRVARVSTSGPAGLARVLVRTLIFCGLLFYVPNATEYVTASDWAWLIASLSGLALVLLPMPLTKDFRGLHELGSGTRVAPVSNSRDPAMAER